MENTNFTEFYEKILGLHGISPLWEKVLLMFKKLQGDMSDEALCVLCIYFSLLDDGNTCISLDSEKLLEKWLEKWRGLLLVSRKNDENEDSESEITKKLENEREKLKPIVEKGFSEISGGRLPNLVKNLGGESSVGGGIENEIEIDKPFVIFHGRLFATKYFRAKITIEEKIRSLIKYDKKNTPVTESEKSKIHDYFQNSTTSRIDLNDEQVQAIIGGQKENLIVTGGPGTGKTTVVCYLLWELLKNKPDFLKNPLYLVAPTGKAADRLKESISGTLSKIVESERKARHEIFEKLDSAQSSTIHRLLGYNPQSNSFIYNRKNPLAAGSILVIDEASMIDITLFASLLEAIPESARVFILGDKDQLPPVEAGAVLGEVLAQKKESVVALIKSNRFSDESDIGRLKNAMQSEEEIPGEFLKFVSWDDWKKDKEFSVPEKIEGKKSEYPVTRIEIDKKKKKAQAGEIVEKWGEKFYAEIAKTDGIAATFTRNVTEEKLNEIWEEAGRARILCAERKGSTGVEEINAKICSLIRKINEINNDGDEFFAGELLMLTKNQKIFNLYNGDTGIVVNVKNPENETATKYLMVKKMAGSGEGPQNSASQGNNRSGAAQGSAGIFQIGGFIFYPLHLLPREAIEVSYAITIHKSQGSGYKAILVFLPDQKGHPLLNRQIVYTAITRTEGSTYIIANADTLQTAKDTLIARDTGIEV